MTSLVVKLNIDRPALSLKAKALSIDWIGAFLFVASACSFLIGIMWGGSQYAWSSMKTILPIVLGTVGLISCLFWEAYGATQPFFRLSLFRSRTSNAAYFCVFLQGLLVSRLHIHIGIKADIHRHSASYTISRSISRRAKTRVPPSPA